MSLLASRKIKKMIESAGFDVSALLDADKEGRNLFQESLAAARTSGPVKTSAPENHGGRIDSLKAELADIERQTQIMMISLEQVLGIKFGGEPLYKFEEKLKKAVRTKVNKQLAMAGHEMLVADWNE